MSSSVDDDRAPDRYVDPYLPKPDLLVLRSLLEDIKDEKTRRSKALDVDKVKDRLLGLGQPKTSSSTGSDSGYESLTPASVDGVSDEDESELRERHPHSSKPAADTSSSSARNRRTEGELDAYNDPAHASFEPAVSCLWDAHDLAAALPAPINTHLLQPYIAWARTVVRNPTDVIMLTHLLLYTFTTIPSAIILFLRPSILHGVLHWLMQSYFTGTYTLMMHQHIHMRGILAPRYRWLDAAFPYVLDPLFGHTWNSYFHHHVKHHHVEGNGPADLSSTIRYQRDSAADFAAYIARFYFLVWAELPLYFFRKGKYDLAAKATACELGTLGYIAVLARLVSFKATLFAYILPLALLRVALMVGNWGQHAFVDELEPDSDFRSSITLIDVPSNRFCYNDGYHTSHHLNPRRHWREHPNAFQKQKARYAAEGALVFRNTDYIMLTVRVLRKDYAHLARCLVPMGSQIGMSQEEIADMLRTKTRRFTEEEIARRFK